MNLDRRSVLGIAAAATSVAGCLRDGESGGFSRTAVEGRELVVEFDESLEPDDISVVDPDGEAFAETSVAAGATRVTFEISMPYTPGEYRIVATQNGDEVAETTQEMAPALEILDVGVGANRMDEMPEERGHAREADAIVEVRNSGDGPESIERLRLNGFLPSDREHSDDRSGIYDPEVGREASSPIMIEAGEKSNLFTSTLPFTFEGDGVDCQDNSQSGEFEVVLHGVVQESYSAKYQVEYSAAESYDGCEIEISGKE